MSNKMTCPVCNAHTSDVWGAVMHDDPCPYCGAPADVILDVTTLRERRADAELKAQVEQLMIQLAKVTAERDRMARIVEGVRDALSDEP